MNFLSVFALAFTLSYSSGVEELANNLEYSKGLSRQPIGEIAKDSIVLTLAKLQMDRANLKLFGPKLEEAAMLLNKDFESIDHNLVRLTFQYKARYIMSAENPMAELLKTMKYIINTFPQNDYERPLTCFLGLMAFEGTGIFFSSIIPENSHQPIIKELLLKIDVDGLNDRSIVFILIASIIYGYRDIFNQSVPSGFRDLFVARTLYKFERKGWNYNG